MMTNKGCTLFLRTKTIFKSSVNYVSFRGILFKTKKPRYINLSRRISNILRRNMKGLKLEEKGSEYRGVPILYCKGKERHVLLSQEVNIMALLLLELCIHNCKNIIS